MVRTVVVVTCLWSVLLAGRFVPAVWSQGTLVDRVVAVVEDEAILHSDVEQGVKQAVLQRGASGLTSAERAKLESQILDELIKNKLVLAKANRLGINVSFSEVEAAVERAVDENKKVLGGQQAFDRQLQAEGLTLDSLKKLYREQIQNRMLVDRVLSREIDRSTVGVSEEELKRAYEERKADFPNRPVVVHLATIFVGLESSEAARTKAEALADSLYERLLAGEDFAKLARKYSEHPSAEAGGNLGKLKLSDFGNRAFAEAAAGLAPGEVSTPVLSPLGYHLIQVTGADSTTGEVEIRHILIRIKANERDVQEVFERAQGIHRRLTEGAAFDSMAVRHSTDAGSAASGGDLGWLRVDDLPDFFRDVLAEMHEGEISPVLRESSGFRIVKLLEREDARAYALDEIRDELKRILEQEKLEKVYNDYLDGLRSEFYVDVRTRTE